MIELLYSQREPGYRFLFPYTNREWHRKLKKIVTEESTSELNKKWRVYAYGTSRDIETYIQLYLIDLRQGNSIRVGKETIRERK